MVIKITVFCDVMYFRETFCLRPWSYLRCSEMFVPIYQVQDLSVGTFLQNYVTCKKVVIISLMFSVHHIITTVFVFKNRSHKLVDDTSTEEFHFE